MVTMLSSSIIELTLLMARLPIFFLQRDNLLFPAWAWSVPMALLSLPVSLWSAGRPSPTTASASPPNSPGKYSFISQLLLFFVTHMAGSALYRAVATVLRSTTVINTLGNFIIVLLFLLSGFIVRACEVRACEVRACEVHACAVRACEVRACEVRAREVCACEVCACEVRACEVRACEVRACEVRACEMCACEVRACEVRACEVRACEVRACEVHACEVCACKVCACEVRACEVRACEVRACEVRACEVRACEMRACEVRACEVRACEVRACAVRACAVRACEVCACEVCACEVCACAVRACEVCACEVRACEVCACEVGDSDIHGVWEWVYWISSLTYCQNAFSANEFLAPRWDVVCAVLCPGTIWAQPVISQHQLDAREIALGSTNLECSSRSSSLCSLTLSRIGSTAIARFLATDRFHSPKSLARPSLSARSLTSLPSGSTKVHLRVMSEGGQGEAGGGELGRDVAESTAWHVLPFDPLTLSFHYVNYYVDMPAELKDKAARPGQRLQLLRNVSGVFRPGVLTALMGVSGYCEQVDIHTPQVTVHESLLYSAWLRLPEEIDRDVILHTIHPFKHTHPTKLPSLISALLSSLSHLRPPLFPLSSPHSSLPSLISALLSSLSHLHTPLFPLSSPHSSLPSLISALLSSLSISALLSSLSISALLSSLSISTLLSSLSISALLSSLSHICTPLFPLSSPHSSLPSLISALLSSLSHICTPLFPLHLRTPLFPLHLRTPLFPLSSLHSSLPSLISALLSSLSHLRTPLFPLSYPHSSLPSLISALLSSLSHLRTPLFPLHLRTPLFPLHLPCPISHLPSQSPLPTPHEIRGGGDGAGGASTEFVEEVEDLVELEPVKGALVGRAGQDGLSVEQRKRLTIAVELVANPAIIFMDEPTSGKVFLAGGPGLCW
ncbi:unnamed protein product [Closterium sp. NIES-65]|nr:unnamed protein product [Closterium sp. NIES-65]